MFSQTDIDQIKRKGMTVDQINQQIEFFKHGIPLLDIEKPAIIGDGILVPDEIKLNEYIHDFETRKQFNTLVKFVPASGAATRMFKSLFEYLAKPSEPIKSEEVSRVLDSLRLFAFFNDLEKKVRSRGFNLQDLHDNGDYPGIIDYILSEKGLNYGNVPKGLIKFHSYTSGNRTSVEEHLVEGAMYASNSNKEVKIHFTVSPEHLERFQSLVDSIKDDYEKKLNKTFKIGFSVQKSYTDTIAVDDNNIPFRDTDGKLVFRPGGHGALLDNLNDIEGDIVFIKNIDNVVPDQYKEVTVKYKKVLAGILIKTQKKVFDYLKELENFPNNHGKLIEIKDFIETTLGFKFSADFVGESPEIQKQILGKILNRPIRVCGMVKNTDQPGGGPFWVKNSKGELSLQILESSQFDFTNEYQKKIFSDATHFNPVDLVISLRDSKGNKFKFSEYTDPATGFISLKSKDGRALKALELPGLWNGAMANWNTIFVEVPLETFNPVKTISDLLRKEHQTNQL